MNRLLTRPAVDRENGGGDRAECWRMLTKDDMMPTLINVCPSFAPAWQEFYDEWRDEPEVPLYVALGFLARHLIGLVERGETDELPAVFRVVERWHVEGDEYVREAATIGLLEDLQNLYLHEHPTDPSQFRAMLGPESRRCWEALAGEWLEFFRSQESKQQPEAGPGATSDPDVT